MEACTMTCVLDLTGTLNVVTWQKIKSLRAQLFEAHTTDTYEQVVKATEEVSKL